MKETKRQQQVSELVKRNFGIVLQSEGSYIYGAQAFVTVTDVKVSPDLGIARIYLSVFNEMDKQSIVTLLDKENTRLRQALAHRIKRHIRRIPHIQFYLDDTLDEMYRLNGLFDTLDKLKEEEE